MGDARQLNCRSGAGGGLLQIAAGVSGYCTDLSSTSRETPPMPTSAFRSSVLLAASLGVIGATLAATTYRWVDEQGRVHYSDVVPDRYKDRARKMDLQPSAPSQEQRPQAPEKMQRTESKARETPTATAPASAPSSPDTERKDTPVRKRPERIPTADTDCETWQRLWEESQECFGPYRTVRRGIKPEAFMHCNEVSEPPPRCRPQLR